MSEARALLLHPDDSVAQLLAPVDAGAAVHVGEADLVVAADAIPAAHKIALQDFAVGDVVRKYGEAIGVATQAIARGQHVHIHNVRSARAGSGDRG